MREAESPSNHSEGEVIGSYRIGQRLILPGQTCFEAERLDYPQKVTIRFVEEEAARFDLDHPHLARVLGQGLTANGEPYHVLEALAGQPLDAYCDTHRLGLHARIELLLQVVDAAAYAHQHLALHCNLSCGSTLVASGDVKIIGFGSVATLTGPSIDSDIRSIGRMLMQLLCGESTIKNRLGKNPMRSALETMATSVQLSVAQARGLTVVQLRKKLNSDLEAIVLKAVRTEERGGYDSCAALSEDLLRYLQGYPISARKADRFEIAYTWSRHHPAPVVAVLVLLFCLISGGVIVLRSTAHARLEERATNERLVELARLTGSLDARFYQALGSQPDQLKMQTLLLDQLRQTLDEATKDLSPGDRANCLLANQYFSISRLDAVAGRSNYAQSETAVAKRLKNSASCANGR
jgi:serine/threonine-protein kinase